MKQCPQCQTWQNNETTACPECGAVLENNEYSSEDADDGYFTEAEAQEVNR